jgi:hypothetical protein
MIFSVSALFLDGYTWQCELSLVMRGSIDDLGDGNDPNTIGTEA